MTKSVSLTVPGIAKQQAVTSVQVAEIVSDSGRWASIEAGTIVTNPSIWLFSCSISGVSRMHD